MISFVKIKFTNYKAFDNYTVNLKQFNLLVGPNNAGKSTVIGAFKILSEGIRKANSRKPEIIKDPNHHEVKGYLLDIQDIPTSTENAFHNYNDTEYAIIDFYLSNKATLTIFFSPEGGCYLKFNQIGKSINSPKDFRREFPVKVGFVPVLGPVDHEEKLYQKETARKALISYTASRNFRNIWFHYKDDFDQFKEILSSTWPGMDIELPKIEYGGKETILKIFCPEERIPREIFWAGYGFQVWCQMLTFIVKNRNSNIFIIDEPDIYLHSDLQRQLLGVLKELGPDIIIATHSTEMINEAEINEIVLINKKQRQSKRITNPNQIQKVFNVIGSNLNPVLTQIAKTKKIIFVEGKDFQVFAKFARKLGYNQVANRANFAVVPVEGFNPQKLRAFKEGIEKTIGESIESGVIFDRDYRSDKEVEYEESDLSKGSNFTIIHSCKEMENFLIVAPAIHRAINIRIKDIIKRANKEIIFEEDVTKLIDELSSDFKQKVFGQLLAKQTEFLKTINPKLDQSTIATQILKEFEEKWDNISTRINLLPGKDFLSSLNDYLQSNYKLNISKVSIIEAMKKDEVPAGVVKMIKTIDSFRKE